VSDFGKYKVTFTLYDVTVEGTGTIDTMVTIGSFDSRIEIEDDARIENADVSADITIENIVDQIYGEDRLEALLGHLRNHIAILASASGASELHEAIGKYRVIDSTKSGVNEPENKSSESGSLKPVSEDQSNPNLIAHMREILESFVAPAILAVVPLPDELERARVLMRLATMLHCSLDIGSTNEGGE